MTTDKIWVRILIINDRGTENFHPRVLASACFGTYGTSLSNFWKYFLWVRITDEGSVPEMRIWSILLIKSVLKWCVCLSRSLFLYFVRTCRSLLTLCSFLPDWYSKADVKFGTRFVIHLEFWLYDRLILIVMRVPYILWNLTTLAWHIRITVFFFGVCAVSIGIIYWNKKV